MFDRGTVLLTAVMLFCSCVFAGAEVFPSAETDGLTASAAAAEIPGIDVSKYQEEIDWNEVAQSGVKFAILRCCKVIRAYDDWELDPRFEENYAGAKAAGLAVGCYMYTDAATSAEFTEDVKYMLGFLKDKSFEFPVFLDMESASRQEHLSPKLFMPALTVGLEAIEDAGHTAGVYSSSAFFSECIDREALREAGYPIWEANYFNSVNGLPSTAGHDLSSQATIWQYSGCGRCSGIRTTVDRNVCYTYQYFTHLITLEEGELPSGTLDAGSDFNLTGTVRGGTVIRNITGSIYRAGETDSPLQTVTVYPHAKEYTIAGFFTKKLTIAGLTPGDYVMKLTAVDASGQDVDVAESEFTVAGDAVAVMQTDPQPSIDPSVQTSMTASAVRPDRPSVTKKKAGFGIRFTNWFYRHMPIRKFLSKCVNAGIKLSLERTPLFRIVRRASNRLEIGYFAAAMRLLLAE